MEPIIARLTYAGANRPTIEADGISVTARTPIFALCRKLDEAGWGDRPLTVVNASTGMPLMEISTIAAGAGRTIIENEKVGPAFRKFSPFAMSSADAED